MGHRIYLFGMVRECQAKQCYAISNKHPKIVLTPINRFNDLKKYIWSCGALQFQAKVCRPIMDTFNFTYTFDYWIGRKSHIQVAIMNKEDCCFKCYNESRDVETRILQDSRGQSDNLSFSRMVPIFVSRYTLNSVISTPIMSLSNIPKP